MATLTFTSNFDDVRQIEHEDDVLGGPGELANEQAQELGNRTELLYDVIVPKTVLVKTADYTIDGTADRNATIRFTGTAATTFILPGLVSGPGAYPAPRDVLIIQHRGGNAPLIIDAGATGTYINDINGFGATAATITLCAGDEVILVDRASDHWGIISKRGGMSGLFTTTGITFSGSGANGGGTAYDFSYKINGNEVELSGSITVNTTGLLEHIASFPAEATPSKTINIVPATIAPTATTYFFCKVDVSGHLSLGASALFAGTLYFDGLKFRLY